MLAGTRAPIFARLKRGSRNASPAPAYLTTSAFFSFTTAAPGAVSTGHDTAARTAASARESRNARAGSRRIRDSCGAAAAIRRSWVAPSPDLQRLHRAVDAETVERGRGTRRAGDAAKLGLHPARRWARTSPACRAACRPRDAASNIASFGFSTGTRARPAAASIASPKAEQVNRMPAAPFSSAYSARSQKAADHRAASVRRRARGRATARCRGCRCTPPPATSGERPRAPAPSRR